MCRHTAPTDRVPSMSPYVRNCTLGGLVALLTGFVSGFLSA